MQEKILNKVEESFLRAEKFYGRTFPRPRVIFKRSGTTAGFATCDCKVLMFQLDLAEHHERDFIDNTVPHEVAHNIQFHIHPTSQAHGYEWKFIMTRVMGILPDRCHSYNTLVTSVKRETRHIYTCPCQKEFKVSTTTHNRIQKALTESKTRKYYDANLQPYYKKPTYSKICSRCRGVITLKELGNSDLQKMERLLKQLQAKSIA